MFTRVRYRTAYKPTLFVSIIRSMHVTRCNRTLTTTTTSTSTTDHVQLPYRLDATTLNQYSQRLEHANPPSYRYRYSEKQPVRDAAVLVPLCMVDDIPSVLFTLRSSHLNTHRGEISFPGGKRDPHDKNLTDTALRETHEEIGIPAEQIHILGMHHPLPDKTLTIRVHPLVAYIQQSFMTKSAPYLLETVFAVSLRELANPARWHLIQFRNRGPLVPEWRIADLPGIPADMPPIWGLTAFILNNVLQTLFKVDRLETRLAWQKIGEAALRQT
ncbi:NUDIX hydrolase domain-like protein [Syncephalis plumigaleata]|nr:NUDIX hydrolase domain-like protein [Syncephalis plumigaleata]